MFSVRPRANMTEKDLKMSKKWLLGKFVAACRRWVKIERNHLADSGFVRKMCILRFNVPPIDTEIIISKTRKMPPIGPEDCT